MRQIAGKLCAVSLYTSFPAIWRTDLRALRYPAWESLVALGRRIGKTFPAQEKLDRLLEQVVFGG